MCTRIPSPRRTTCSWLVRAVAVAGVAGALVLPGAAAHAITLPEDRSAAPPM